MRELSTSPQTAIAHLETVMREMPQAEIKTEHMHGPGFYARTITIPAGVTLVGKVHATEHIFIVSKGDITLVTDGEPQRVQAPFQAVCKPGLRRAGFTHAETVCTNIHITEETDLLKLESDLIIAPALEAPEAPEESK